MTERGIHKSTSASQVKTYRECARKWFFDKIIKVPRKEGTKAQNLGSVVHKHLEQWVEFGIEPVGCGDCEGKYKKDKCPICLGVPIAKSALHLCPPPMTDNVTVEEYFKMPTGVTSVEGKDIKFVGYIDILERSIDKAMGPAIYDHKTSSNPKRYGLCEADIPNDVQMTAYGKFATVCQPGYGDSVYLGLNYMKTRGAPSPYRVGRWVPNGQIEEAWEKTLGTVQEMKDVSCRELPDVPRNTSACTNYGGCPYLNMCYEAKDVIGIAFEMENPLETKLTAEAIKPYLLVLEKPQIDAIHGINLPGIITTDFTPVQLVNGIAEKLGGTLEAQGMKAWVDWARENAPSTREPFVNPPEDQPAPEPVVTTEEDVKAANGAHVREMRRRLRLLGTAALRNLVFKDRNHAVSNPEYAAITSRVVNKIKPLPSSAEVVREGGTEFAARGYDLDALEALLTRQDHVDTPIERIAEQIDPTASTYEPVTESGPAPMTSTISLEEFTATYKKMVAKDLNSEYFATAPYTEGEKKVAELIARGGWPEGVSAIRVDSRVPGAQFAIDALKTLLGPGKMLIIDAELQFLNGGNVVQGRG